MREALELRACVLRGVDVLCDKKPDWFDTIPLENFDMFTIGGCVLSRTCESYMQAFAELGISVQEAKEYGFATNSHAEYPILTKFWLEFIRMLRSAQDILMPYGGEVIGFGPDSVGSKGDGRVYELSLMVQLPLRMPMEYVAEVSTKLTNRVRGISRILIDVPAR